MAFDYSEFITLGQELLGDFGRAVTIERLAATPADPAKPWQGSQAPVVEASVATTAVFLPHEGLDFGQQVMTTEQAKRAMQVALVPAIANTPLQSYSRIVDGGSTWNIDWCQVLKPGPDIIMYAFGLKR